MDPLGQLFETVKSLSGPQLIYHIPKWNIYLLGENHEKNGDVKNNQYILDVIENYAKGHPDIHIKLLVELTKESVYLHAHNNNPISPLSTYANELHKHHYLPKNVSTVMADVRRVPPFNLLEAIYDYDSFAFIQGLHIDEPRDLYAKSKKFEKAFFQHTNTSKKCIRFFKSIIEPHTEPQQWFMQSLKDFSISDTNVIKTTLATIKTHNEFAYNYIMKTLTRVLEDAISTQNEYSLAMDKAEKTRHTNSPNFVANMYIYFKAFWIAINS